MDQSPFEKLTVTSRQWPHFLQPESPMFTQLYHILSLMNPAFTLITYFTKTHLNKTPSLPTSSKWSVTFNIYVKYIHKFSSCLTLHTMSITTTNQLRLFTVRITLNIQIHSAGNMWNFLVLQQMACIVTTRFQTVLNMLDVRVSAEFIWITRAVVDSHEHVTNFQDPHQAGISFPSAWLLAYTQRLCSVELSGTNGVWENKQTVAAPNGYHSSQVSFWKLTLNGTAFYIWSNPEHSMSILLLQFWAACVVVM
jgi:hypothetical protein